MATYYSSLQPSDEWATREALTSATLPQRMDLRLQPHKGLVSLQAVYTSALCTSFFYPILLLDLVPRLWQARSNPRYTHHKITTTANSLDFLKEFLFPSFGGVFLSNQCHLLQTISWEVPVLQIYSKQFSQYCKKLGRKLCSSFKPVMPEELSLQKAE